MTVTDNGNRDIARDTLTDPEARAAARLEWHASGGTLTGKDLGAMYGRSPRWGQDQRRAAAAEAGETVARPTPAPEAVSSAPRPPSAPRTRRRHASAAVHRVTAAAVGLVALVAAVASYNHMRALAFTAGEGEMAQVLPLSVDGLVVAATMALLAARRGGRKAGVLPWLALSLGLGASLAANVAAAEPTVVARLVAAWPPAALALSFELFLRQTPGDR